VKPIYGADKLLPTKIFRQQYKTKYVTIDFTQATRKCKHRTNNAITPPAIRRAVIIHIHMYYGPITYCYTCRQTQFKLSPLWQGTHFGNRSIRQYVPPIYYWYQPLATNSGFNSQISNRIKQMFQPNLLFQATWRCAS